MSGTNFIDQNFSAWKEIKATAKQGKDEKMLIKFDFWKAEKYRLNRFEIKTDFLCMFAYIPARLFHFGKYLHLLV